jgi:O-antigen/teichoic acid export membrane protein
MVNHLRRYQRDLWLVAGFLILPLLLFGNVTLTGQTMVPADNLFQWQPWQAAAAEFDVDRPQNALITDLVIQNYPWKQFIRQSLSQGEIPLWNPHLFAGMPFLATGQNAGYYPFSIFFLLLPLSQAYGWYTISQLWLAGALAYFLGRVLGLKRPSAFIAGLVYQGCGFMLTSAAVFPMIIGAAAWLPLLLACIEKIVQSRAAPDDGGRRTEDGEDDLGPPSSVLRPDWTLLWVLLGAVALGMQLLAGHVEITYYTLLVMGLFAAWRLFASGKWQVASGKWQVAGRRLVGTGGWLLGMVVLGLMLGAVQLVPLFEIGQVNFREGSATLAEVRSWGFPLRRVVTLTLPNFFGNPTHHGYVDALTGAYVSLPGTSEWGIKNYVEGGIYFGILPLLLLVLGVWHGLRQRVLRHHTLFWVGLSGFSLAVIFGTPLYAILYYGLPFINQLHTPFRWVFPLSLCVAVLAGQGVDYLLSGKQDLSGFKNLTGLGWLTGLAIGGGLLLLTGLLASRLAFEQIEPMVDRVFRGLALADLAFPDARAFYSYQFRHLLILAGMLIGSGVIFVFSQYASRITHHASRFTPHASRFTLGLAALLIMADVSLANWGFHTAVSPTLLDYKPQMVQWLEEQPGPWRLTSYNPGGDIPFNANSGWLFGFEDIRGYDSMIPKQYTDYMKLIEPQGQLEFNRIQPLASWDALHSPLLDVLNVKYVITSEWIESPKYTAVWEGEGVRIFENVGAVPRAYTLPAGSLVVVDDALAALTEYDPRQHVVVEEGDLTGLEQTTFANLSGLSEPANYTSAEVEAYSNIEVVVTAVTDQPSFLILNDSYFPGWKAFVRPLNGDDRDEFEAPVSRVNGNFRGVLLDEGEWQVRFRYSPITFQLGGLASALGVLVILFSLGVWGWQQVNRPQATLSLSRSLAKNSFVPMALNLFNKAIDFVFAAFYLRVLGPAAAGSYASAIAAAGLFDIISNFGLNMLLIREVSQDRSRASSYLLNTSLLRIGTGLLGSIPIFLYLWGVNAAGTPLPRAEVLAILLIMVGMVFSGMAQGVTGLFYVYEQAEVPAAMTTVTTLLKVGFGVTVLLLGYGFVGLAAVSILVNLITLTLLMGLALRRFDLPGPWRVDWRLQQRMVQMGYPLMLIHLLQTVFISIDVIILRQLSGEEVVGWYNSAYKWFNALQIIPSFFTLALFPIISREITRSLESARRMYRLSLKLMLLLALPIAASTTFMATFLVQVVAGDEFLPHGAVALQLVMWAIPIGWLNSVTNYVLISLGLERMQPRAFAIAVGFNVTANLIFIPLAPYGYEVAAVTTILSELVLLILFDYYLRQKMPGFNWWSFLWRPGLVTAVSLITMWGGTQLIGWPVGVPLGLLVYAAGLWLLGVIGDEERQVIAAILPGSLASRLKLL